MTGAQLHKKCKETIRRRLTVHAILVSSTSRSRAKAVSKMAGVNNDDVDSNAHNHFALVRNMLPVAMVQRNKHLLGILGKV